jgi:MoCo/4Fe-4S cofactor protein with predicted Tat translocation signal
MDKKDLMEEREEQKLDLEAVRQKLAGSRGKEYWRSLDEVADTPEFRKWVDDEFPNRESIMQIDRRDFLKFCGASLLLAGLAGCRPLGAEKIVPYVVQPEDMVPGMPQMYATAMPFSGYAVGLLVRSHEGRPTKIEGNPLHPASLGSTDAITQAAILNLYDPDRARTVTFMGDVSTWDDFASHLGVAMAQHRENGGAGLRILTETVSSPTLGAQMQALLNQFPNARWHQWEPVNRDNMRLGSRLALGGDFETIYDLSIPNVILSLDADFLMSMPGSVRYARDFMNRRRRPENGMNRLYSIESMTTITGAVADHRLPVRASEVEAVARAIAGRLGVPGGGGQLPQGVPAQWIDALVRDLQAGPSLVIPGEGQPPAVHALAHAINSALGATAATVIPPVVASPVVQLESLRNLVTDMRAGQVQSLIILGGNPAFTAPSDFNFAELLKQIPFRVHLSTHLDETSELCDWHLPESHFLESWSDARAYDGTTSIIQPLIHPLYNTRTAHEVISLVAGQSMLGFDIVRQHWGGQLPGNFEDSWRRALHHGVVPNTAAQAATGPGIVFAAPAATIPPPSPTIGADQVELIFRPDPHVWDGRFANNGWLQELPKPITNLTWDNAAMMSPAYAERLGVGQEDRIQISHGGFRHELPVWLIPGHPDNSITVHLGYGRWRAGAVGDKAGFNVYPLRTSATMNFAGIATPVRGRGKYPLATTQLHHYMEGRDIVRSGSLAELRDNPTLEPEHFHGEHFPSLYHKEELKTTHEVGEGGVTEAPRHGKMRVVPAPTDPNGRTMKEIRYESFFEYEGNQWAMVVDQNTCIGCNACVIACQAENNIPVVGKKEVQRGREMHWIRIDRYYGTQMTTDKNAKQILHNPEIHFQPMLCVHCEHAPCEPVCPVAATIHSHDGLNQMVYNRCVGTRYCSNNCPYKVRRFNYINYTAFHKQFADDGRRQLLKLASNPDVTVRGRGVMEKCTYCIQRINVARIEAKKENRRIEDGEVVPACAQACPTQTIIFGDLEDPNSQVRRWKHEARNYGVLADLNTRPRTTYLARVRNPNPEIEAL